MQVPVPGSSGMHEWLCNPMVHGSLSAAYGALGLSRPTAFPQPAQPAHVDFGRAGRIFDSAISEEIHRVVSNCSDESRSSAASPLRPDVDMSFCAAALMELAQGAGRATERPRAESQSLEVAPATEPSQLRVAASCSDTPRADAEAPPKHPKPSHAPAPIGSQRVARRSAGPAAPKSTPAVGAPGGVHVVLPRRKAGELDAPERGAVVVTPEALSSLFHHPLAVASRKLGLSATTIKKLCRKLGIHKWPYKSPFRTPRAASAGAAGRAPGRKQRGSAASEAAADHGEDRSRSTPSPTATPPESVEGGADHSGESAPASPPAGQARSPPLCEGRDALMRLSSILVQPAAGGGRGSRREWAA